MEYWLPDKDNGSKMDRVKTKNGENCVIIIGANGSGKSRLIAAMEAKDDIENKITDKGIRSLYLRINAQRILNFSKRIPLKGYDSAENYLINGSEKISRQNTKAWTKWQVGDNEAEPNGLTTVLNDFNYALAALISKHNSENQQALKNALQYAKNGENKDVTQTVLKWGNENCFETLKHIWRRVLPEREIEINDDNIMASLQDSSQKAYFGKYMSDGERTCLYLIAQSLSAPSGETIVVDEPELHLHPSIMNRLWFEIEKARPDCHYIFVTHDTEFAAQHMNAEIVWVKSYDGHKWDYEVLNSGDELPDQLLLSILGSRQKILFIEGRENSWDIKLYRQLFNNMRVIACESCTNVIERTKAYLASSNLHHVEIYGLIDRDYLTEQQIEKYKQKNIFTLNVAEVENLFLTEKLLKSYCDWQNLSPNDTAKLLTLIKKKVIKDFQTHVKQQCNDAIIRYLKYELSKADIKPKNVRDIDDIREKFTGLVNDITDNKAKKIENKFQALVYTENYQKILACFNEKGLIQKILPIAALESNIDNIDGKLFSDYQNYIVRALGNEEKRKSIQSALENCFPKELWELNGDLGE